MDIQTCEICGGRTHQARICYPCYCQRKAELAEMREALQAEFIDVIDARRAQIESFRDECSPYDDMDDIEVAPLTGDEDV